jgi:hypothetical protein
MQLNTKKFKEVCRKFSPNSGTVYALRSDGTILKRKYADSQWFPYKKFKDPTNLTEERFLKLFKEGALIDWYRGCQPRLEEIMRMELDGIAETPHCECRVEPDGECIHGRKAWPSLVLAF